MSSTILPPRFEDREADLDGLPVIPIYEEVGGSLRPTWIPIDPTTWVPPAPKKSRAGAFVAMGFAAISIWAIGFAAVVGGHMYIDHRAKMAAASAVAPPDTTTAETAKPAAPKESANATATASKPADTGVTLTVNVNDLPVSRDAKPHGRKSHGRGS